MSDISRAGESGLRVELLPVEDLRRAFLRVGLKDGMKAVIYSPSVVQATRVWFTLDYLGLGKKASLLNGGLNAWKAEGRPVSQDPPPAPADAGKLTVKPRPQVVVNADWIAPKIKNGSLAVIDARLPEFYTGQQPGADMPRAGHIPTGRNVPYTTLIAAEHQFLPAEQLREKFAGGKAPVVYCHIGMQATVAYFAASYLGLSPRLYDGSWQDWSRRSELPTATGAGN